MQNEKRTHIGRVLRLARIANDLSTQALSAKTGLSQGFISEVESGKKKPSLDTLDKYSKALGISKSTIMFFEEKENEEEIRTQELLYRILEKWLKEN